MKRKTSKLLIEATLVTIFEVLCIGLFFTFYILDLWNLKSILAVEYIVYGVFVIAVLNLGYVFRILGGIKKARKENVVQVTDVIGNDVNQAYLFGKIGLIACDEDFKILWISDLFKDRQIELLNKDIFVVFPELKAYVDKGGKDAVLVHKNNVDYNVQYLKEAKLFIFKDVTDYEYLSKYSKNHAIVLGIIIVDNYADIIVNDEDNNELIMKVRDAIFDYARQNNLLLRHIRNDTYFVVCTYESLVKVCEDKFSILDNVKACGIGETIIPTLSIGFAHDFPDVSKLNDIASNAVDIAMSRGGDQAVVSKFGSELKFYGGKTEAVEKRNKVKVRVNADSLGSLIDRAKNVVVMGHIELDMDALGSCLGVRALVKARKKEVKIIFETKLVEKKTRIAMTSLFSRDQLEEMVLTTKEALDYIKPTTLLIVVDVSKPSQTIFPKALELTDKVVVIDHHRRAEEFIYNPVLSYIEPSSSSACELIAEFIKYGSNSSSIKLDNVSATIMLSGIFLDTGFFKSKTVGLRTFEACMVLKEFGADNYLADDLLKDEYEEFALVNKIVTTMKTPYYGIVYCMGEEDEIIDSATLAKSANKCLSLKGINAAFAIGRTSSDSIKISARSDGSVNIQLICERLGGGGHLSMAAVVCKNKTLKEVEATLLDALSVTVSEARSERKGD